MILNIAIFLGSCFLLFLSGKWLIGGLIRISKFLGWKEFVVAFLTVSFASSVPNLFVGITSALQNIPQLAFGDILGNNMMNLTVAVALATLFCKGLPAESRMVQVSAVFTMVAAVLPLILLLDGTLSRADGIILISLFFIYIGWLFSKKERFSKVYEGEKVSIMRDFKNFLKDILKVIAGLLFLLAAAQGIVKSATFFAEILNFPLVLVGILIVGVGSSLPELYFSSTCARKGQGWMVLGNLMGSVIILSSLVLGLVVLISPISSVNFSSLAIARAFTILAASFFLYAVRSNQKIVRKEAVFLLCLFVFFVLFEILIH